MSRRHRQARLLATLAAAGVLFGACTEPQPSPPPVGPSPVASMTLSEIHAWISFRLVYELRADLEWVVAVAADPTASDDFGVPLLPAEAELVIGAQATAQALVGPARRYGEQYDLDFVGLWIEGPVVVLGFSDHVDQRRPEVQALFAGNVTVREVRYSHSQLDGFVLALERDRGSHAEACDGLDDRMEPEPDHCRDGADWFELIGVEVVQIHIDTMANAVRMS